MADRPPGVPTLPLLGAAVLAVLGVLLLATVQVSRDREWLALQQAGPTPEAPTPQTGQMRLRRAE
jgi:hypothetical protein